MTRRDESSRLSAKFPGLLFSTSPRNFLVERTFQQRIGAEVADRFSSMYHHRNLFAHNVLQLEY